MTEDERYLVVGIEDGWICPSDKALNEYYKIKKEERGKQESIFRRLIKIQK